MGTGNRGHVVPRHTKNLIKIIKQQKKDPIAGAEIGVRLGKNAIGLLREFPKLNLVLVDNYIGAERVKDIATHRVQKAFDHDKRYRWWFSSSTETAQKYYNRVFDFVFIDANHSYESVKEDIEAWLPKVFIGGLLAGHDFTPQFEGVQKAVRERFGDKFSVVGNIWYIQVTGDY